MTAILDRRVVQWQVHFRSFRQDHSGGPLRTPAELELPLTLDLASATPLHTQLAAQLKQAALGGVVLTPGARLPSTRVLAARLGVARSTVLAAFEQLDGEGFLVSRSGLGTYLSEHLLASPPMPAAKDPPPVVDLGPSPGLVDLRPGQPSDARLADAAWIRAWRTAARGVPVVEPPRQGLAELRQQIADHLAAARGLAVDPSTIFVTAGTSDALCLLVYALGLGGQTVAVEDPGHSDARRLRQRLGCRLAPVEVDDDGLRVTSLPDAQTVPTAVLVTPSHQYPLGGRLPIDRRLALLSWASATGAIIIEDDYDSEFRFDVAPLPALASVDRNGQVVHLGTFSKVLTPWLRAGYLTAPAWLLPALLDVRGDLGTPISGVDQRALATYLEQGSLRRHVARVRRGYAHSRTHLRRRLALHQPTLLLRGIDAGLHAVIDLPPHMDVAAVLLSLQDQGFRLASLDEYRTDPARPGPPAVVLGYGNATLTQLDQVVTALARAADQRQ